MRTASCIIQAGYVHEGCEPVVWVSALQNGLRGIRAICYYQYYHYYAADDVLQHSAVLRTVYCPTLIQQVDR